MGTNVNTKNPQYIDMVDTWVTMTDTCASEKVMHSKGTRYLPILDQMTDDQYDAYVARSEFPMFTKHALDAFVGMAMRKNLLITGIDVDHPFFKNCDSKGTTLKGYAEQLVRNYLQYGRGGTMIDYPKANPNQSKAAAEADNVKSRLSYYAHDKIINWKTKVVNNEEILVLVVLQESVDTSTDIFTHDPKPQYRVLRFEGKNYIQEVYNDSFNVVETITPTMGGKPLDFLPFVIHGGNDVRSPVMSPIAEQNIHWYMKSADYNHGLHYVALPTPWVEGVDAKDKYAPKTIGPQVIWYLPVDATCGMLEFTGKGLGEIAKSMSTTLANITVLSSQILVPKNAYDETATAASIRNATETASLSSVVSFLSTELTLAVTIASKWGGFYVEGTKVEINSDFIPLTLSGADVSSYVSSVIKEGFSKKTLFELLKKGEIIDGDRQYKDEMNDIEMEAQVREDQEVKLAKRLAEATAVETDPPDSSKEGPDTKQSTTQKSASTAETNSGDKKSKDNN